MTDGTLDSGPGKVNRRSFKASHLASWRGGGGGDADGENSGNPWAWIERL